MEAHTHKNMAPSEKNAGQRGVFVGPTTSNENADPTPEDV